MYKNPILTRIPKPHLVALSTAGLLMGTGFLLTDELPAQPLRQEVQLMLGPVQEGALSSESDTTFLAALPVDGSISVAAPDSAEASLIAMVPSQAEPVITGEKEPAVVTVPSPVQSTGLPSAPPRPEAPSDFAASLPFKADSPDVKQTTATSNASANAPGEAASRDDEPTSEQDSLREQRFTIRNGDTLSGVFKKAGFSDVQIHAINAGIKDKSWARIYPGETIGFVSDRSGDLQEVRIKRSQLEQWIISRVDDQPFRLEKKVRTTDLQTTYAEGKIDSAFFTAGQKAGLSGSMIMELAGLFSWDVDFALDIREGDSFKVIYETINLDGQRIGTGNILAAEFTNQGRAYTAVRFVHQDGRTSYYDANGNSLKKAFLRAPIDFARISSHFSLNRKHPVLHRFRAHKGTDYAASTGTPIKSTGDGKVLFAGVKGGYGNVVILQHGQGITTLYGHMQRFAKGIRSGSRIDQGQIIGYVGSTGLASGPHCHYEFRVHGVHKNPVTVPLPKAEPVPRQERAAFRRQADQLLARLGSFSESYQVALEDSQESTAPNL